MRLAKFTITAVILGSSSLLGVPAASALDHVVLRRDGKQIEVAGKLLVAAQDGGLLLMARDGVLWAVTPDELVSKSSDAAPFEPLGAKELGAKILADLPAGFDCYETAHYLIVYNTSRGYAQWCGSLFERLYMAFTNHWTRKGFELSEPEFPLVALVFADRRSYADYARPEIGDNAGSIIGYFSLASNRMAMYDLTGTQALNRTTDRNSAAEINRILAQPAAERIVATIVHEATHQIAFNCGLHTRYSDCPLWFSEGIAVYFETPDLGSSRGWRSIGTVNTTRLAQFRQSLRSRPSDSLVTLIRDDERLRKSGETLDAYAEAWALTYFLIRQYPRQYLAYLKTLSEKTPLIWDEPETRIREFKAAFGEDLHALDAEFLRYMGKVR
ncbi:MAG: DUF1570 domain-containing protein [Rhodopirellula sp.]|nr:DUF1570 domain-containing protein [Rhodopirellula sp.]